MTLDAVQVAIAVVVFGALIAIIVGLARAWRGDE